MSTSRETALKLSFSLLAATGLKSLGDIGQEFGVLFQFLTLHKIDRIFWRRHLVAKKFEQCCSALTFFILILSFSVRQGRSKQKWLKFKTSFSSTRFQLGTKTVGIQKFSIFIKSSRSDLVERVGDVVYKSIYLVTNS